jgi:hypothetical protein
MSLLKRVKTSIDYCGKLLHAGVDGGISGWEASVPGKGLIPFHSESARTAIGPIAIGACIGALSSHPGDAHTAIRKALAYAFLGAAIGFGACVAWRGRPLLASVASGALKKIGRVRDEHWLEGHPIDYA